MGRPSAIGPQSRLGADGRAEGTNVDGVDLVAALSAGPDILAIVARDGTVRALTGPVEQVLGSPAPATGSRFVDRVHPDDVEAAIGFLAAVASEPRNSPKGPVQWRTGTPEVGWRAVEATATNRIFDPAIRGIVVAVRDVADRAAMEAQLRHDAFHDQLTGLPNRSLFYDKVEQALATEGRCVALLYLDLDGFKSVNDTLGHATGDAVLVEVASRLRTGLRAMDTAARLGGDEFGVLLAGITGPGDAIQAARRLLGSFLLPLTGSVVLHPSVGIAVANAHGVGADELLRRADLAMYQAKGNPRRPWALYESGLEADSRSDRRRPPAGWFARSREQRDEVLAVLDRDDAIVPVFQPVMDLRTGLVAGYEALARFPHSGQGKSPMEWFAAAHRCGLGYRLEAKAISAALAVDDRPPSTWLSINMSPSGLCSADVQAVLPDRLDGIVIEITENEAVPDDEAFHAARDSIRDRGGRLAVDDTGAGYANLRQLMRLRPETLKLDRSVVDGIAGDPAKAALVQSLVHYARVIGATVCAEGIETLEDLEAVADLDVTFGQGYVIARPVDPWANAAPTPTRTCLASFARSLRRDAFGGDTAEVANDRRLEYLTWQIAEARTYGELHRAVEVIAGEIHADEISLSALDEDADDLVFVSSRGVEHFDERFPLSEYPETRRILRDQEAAQLLVGDPMADRAEISVLNRLGMRSVLMLPIVCAGRSIGLFEAYAREERPWSRFEIGRARIITLQLGAALERISRET